MITNLPASVKIRPSIGAPRLFAAGLRADSHAHARVFGQMPQRSAAELLAEIEASGLDGRGGAGFAAYRKLVSTEPRNSTVIINAAEGEHLSYKDRVLLENARHLVFDGAQLAAQMVGATRIVLFARAESVYAVAADAKARGIEVVEAPGTFISGEASAVVNAVLTGTPKPFDHVKHLNTSEKTGTGFRTRRRGPMLVHNAETLAHLALIARYGATWFRATGGTGTRLFTVYERAITNGNGSHDIAHVVEAPEGITVTELYEKLGLSFADNPAVLIGGLQGRWAEPHDYAQPLGTAGIPTAAGIIYPLLPTECVLTEGTRAVNYLAAQNAQQCGPCTNGLPALADVLAEMAHPSLRYSPDQLTGRIQQLQVQLAGRGICKHPDATVRFALHTAQLAAREAELHAHGQCSAQQVRSLVAVG